MKALFQLRPGYQITPIIMYACVTIFVMMVLLTQSVMWFDARTLAQYGANYGPATLAGEPWRLFTAMFLHAGLVHIFFNMVVLANIGMLLEPLIGKWLFIGVYVATGILASLASTLLNYGAVSVGASGAIFGLYGVFLGLLLGKFFTPEASKQMLRGTLAFIAINIVIGFLIGPIDNAAHLGGAISGVVLGIILIPVVRWRLRRL